jgi:hypothetical protein
LDTQTQLSLSTLLLRAFKAFASDLHGWAGLFKVRLKASSRRRATLFSSWVSGRSLWTFRNIAVSQGASVTRYAPVGKCIYCNATVYSKRLGGRQFPLGAEHIIAEGLGGKIELPEASCQTCEDATGRLVEGDVLGRTLKALRVFLKLKKRGSGRPPKTLPLTTKVDGKEATIEIPTADYPIFFNMLRFGPPTLEPNTNGAGRAIVGLQLSVLKYDAKELYQKYRADGGVGAYWDNHAMTRMLAKIGHSFAVAELGSDKFAPLLLDLIRTGDTNAMNLIGGDPDADRYPSSKSLHDIALGYQRLNGSTYVVTKVRLFASYGGPIYLIIVGKSLESPIARLKRVLSNRISMMRPR